MWSAVEEAGSDAGGREGWQAVSLTLSSSLQRSTRAQRPANSPVYIGDTEIFALPDEAAEQQLQVRSHQTESGVSLVLQLFCSSRRMKGALHSNSTAKSMSVYRRGYLPNWVAQFIPENSQPQPFHMVASSSVATLSTCENTKFKNHAIAIGLHLRGECA